MSSAGYVSSKAPPTCAARLSTSSMPQPLFSGGTIGDPFSSRHSQTRACRSRSPFCRDHVMRTLPQAVILQRFSAIGVADRIDKSLDISEKAASLSMLSPFISACSR